MYVHIHTRARLTIGDCVRGLCSGGFGFRGGRGGFPRAAMPRGGARGGARGRGGGGRGGGGGRKPMSDADLDKGMEDYFKD